MQCVKPVLNSEACVANNVYISALVEVSFYLPV